MKRTIIACIMMLVSCTCLFSHSDYKIKIPEFNDKYSKYVQQLEAGKLDIDYQDFRYSFLKSSQFAVSKGQFTELNELKKEMYKQIDSANYQKVLLITKKMLSIDYTNMLAHKILRQTYKIIGDTLNASKYKTIQFGLLYSIINHGDGKTAKTAWPVIQIEEEYFILGILGAKVTSQALISDKKKPCDKMTVIEEGAEKVYYFDVTKVFEGYDF